MFASMRSTFVTWPSIGIIAVIFSLIITACYCGDKLLLVQNRYYRAACDNFTHACIGGLCWAVVESDLLLTTWSSWISCLICVFLAMAVDFDHFLAAGTLNLEKASHLSTRPIFHNTSVIVMVVLACWLLRHRVDGLTKFALMFLSSWLSHHLRDANRRGLWIFPFGSTPPFPFYFYVGSILMLSLFVRFAYKCDISSRVIDKSIDSIIA